MGLVKNKGFFPYDCYNSFQKAKEVLARKNKFYNSLTTCEISDEDHEQIVIIWKTFRTKQEIKNYCDLYLNINILLLAIVLKIIKVESINSFGLDPAHYLSTPGYSWDAMLRFTDANLKLISGIEKCRSIEIMIRGI